MTLPPLGWLGIALLVALPAAAVAEVSELPPLPDRNPLRAPVEAKPVLPGDQPTVPWTEVEIAAAVAECKELLSADTLDYEPLPPIKEGLCGAPAPILLRAAGEDPKVAIEPPATLSCPLAHVLGKWLKDTVEPKAMALFGSPVVKIRNASSYVCRNRYGSADKPLSEHALANAFDVSQFELAEGRRITVLDDWPRLVKADPDAAPPSEPPSGSGGERGESAITPANAPADAPTSPPPVAAEPDPKSRFVTFLFEDACRHFGTVLGPNANEAHKDHFHLDMKKRKKGFCE